jgi:hypothetical protein
MQPVSSLHTLLRQSQPNQPEPEPMISKLHENRCQVGQYAFFSGE